jgi:hypothetical protein
MFNFRLYLRGGHVLPTTVIHQRENSIEIGRIIYNIVVQLGTLVRRGSRNLKWGEINYIFFQKKILCIIMLVSCISKI